MLNGRSSDNFCFMMCFPLQGYLSAIGVKTSLVEGELMRAHHCWLEMEDGTIIDPTLDQFQSDSRIIKLPKVFIGSKDIYGHKKIIKYKCYGC